jgi:hypothetical protein
MGASLTPSQRAQLAGRRATLHGSVDASCSTDVYAPTFDDFASCAQYSTPDTTLASGDVAVPRRRPLTLPAEDLDHKLEFLNDAGLDTHAFDTSRDSLPQDVEEVLPSTDVRDVFALNGARPPTAVDAVLASSRFTFTPALERRSWMSDVVTSSHSGETRVPLAVHLASRFSFTPATERTSWLTTRPSPPLHTCELRSSEEGLHAPLRPPLTSRFSFTPATERMSWLASSPDRSPGSSSSTPLDGEGGFPLTPLSNKSTERILPAPSPPSPLRDIVSPSPDDLASQFICPPSEATPSTAPAPTRLPSACAPPVFAAQPSSPRRDALDLEVVVHRPTLVTSPSAADSVPAAAEALRRQALLHLSGLFFALACTAAVYPLTLSILTGAQRIAGHVLFPLLLIAEVLLLANLLRFHYRRIHANAELLGRKTATSPVIYLTEPSVDSTYDNGASQPATHARPVSPSNATLVDMPLAATRRSLGDRVRERIRALAQLNGSQADVAERRASSAAQPQPAGLIWLPHSAAKPGTSL